jgi:cytochrome c-type biogenesis protein CcmH/NrfG
MRVLDSNLSQWEKKPKQVPQKNKPQILLFWFFATRLVQASKQANKHQLPLSSLLLQLLLLLLLLLLVLLLVLCSLFVCLFGFLVANILMWVLVTLL